MDLLNEGYIWLDVTGLAMCDDWIIIFNILKNLSMSVFKWDNVPDSINRRALELELFNWGKVAWFKDDVGKLRCLKATLAGELDIYYEPKTVKVIGGSGYNQDLENFVDCTVMYNNQVRDTPYYRLCQYAKRIANMEQTIDINIHAQRTPILMRCTKQTELSIKKIYADYDGKKPVIFLEKNSDLDEETIKVIKTDAPFVADKIEVQRKQLWNDVLSYIGRENNSSEKKERLTGDEIEVSQGMANANLYSKLLARQEGLELVNKMFNTDIKVSVNEKVLESFPYEEVEEVEEVIEE